MIACEQNQEALMHGRMPLGIIVLVPGDGIGKSASARP